MIIAFGASLFSAARRCVRAGRRQIGLSSFVVVFRQSGQAFALETFSFFVGVGLDMEKSAITSNTTLLHDLQSRTRTPNRYRDCNYAPVAQELSSGL